MATANTKSSKATPAKVSKKAKPELTEAQLAQRELAEYDFDPSEIEQVAEAAEFVGGLDMLQMIAAMMEDADYDLCQSYEDQEWVKESTG